MFHHSLVELMDRRLWEAAQKGDVHHLQSLIKEDPLILRAVPLAGTETPLHITCLSGHLDFAKEIINLRPEFARELNQDGFTPLHIASANGDIEIVKLLLNVVDLVLDENVVAKGTVEVNSLNKRGLTPLELLFKESGDRDIEEILRASGAVSVENLQQEALPQSWVVPVQDPSNEQSSREQRGGRPRSRSKKLQDFFKYNKTIDPPGKVRDTLLVIAILIATATYQTVLSPPGGVWQDTYWSDGNNNTSNDGIIPSRRIAGQSVMGTDNPISYGLFLVFNSIGFFVSLHTINFLTIGFPLQLELQVSLVALTVTYDTVMSAITPNRGISLFFTIFSIVFPVFLPHITMLLRNYCKKPKFLIKICELFT
ncbi:hypothetical protein RND71_001366 [Anisodus tanguticus]|uniref:PGG domain-containing protein n=1 Tax=Anisodus tanguticus TaxID=243964 RepID=A0AAE1T0P6_9SOLA|nr:hypothetical protein RND71_001366 [Anisodus tanguticus]